MATTLSPDLSFPGNTREVFAFYAQALDATVEAMLTYADMPRPPEPEPAAQASGCCVELPPAEAVMHGCLLLPGGARLMAGDAPPGIPFDGVKGVMLALQVDTVAQAERAFTALATGGHRWPRHDAAGPVVLGEDLRHADRPPWRELGGQRRAGPDGLMHAVGKGHSP